MPQKSQNTRFFAFWEFFFSKSTGFTNIQLIRFHYISGVLLREIFTFGTVLWYDPERLVWKLNFRLSQKSQNLWFLAFWDSFFKKSKGFRVIQLIRFHYISGVLLREIFTSRTVLWYVPDKLVWKWNWRQNLAKKWKYAIFCILRVIFFKI